ncbi:MAG: agmatine deiminase family protein [Candidatus Hydrogenedentes bacterium]|nr:agmatine deiminase family protein [Candidatus Hydrogenedentota bacterium]
MRVRDEVNGDTGAAQFPANTTKSELRLPAEWEPQAGVQLTWPHAASDWAPILERVEVCFCEIAAAIAGHETVLVACPDPDHIGNLLNAHGVPMERVNTYKAKTNDTWARDHGPITIYDNGASVLCDFVFNGWGNKFPAALDNALTANLHGQNAYGPAPLRIIDFVLEGGSIESDGTGTLLTTSRCLLSPTRNPGKSRSQIEDVLNEVLGARRVLWLEHGYIAGDDTDSHVDTLARFCSTDTIAYVACRDETDEHFAELRRMEEELRSFRTESGQPYRLVPLPFPRACYDEDGARMPATYANFLIVNGAVLAPTYGVPQDDEALSIIQSCFPDREVAGVDCSSLIVQHGSLHCVTMQLPEGITL